MPSLRQLDYLVAISDTLHFRRAAEKVNTTQSTLSTQVKVLEDRLGVILIERSRSQVMLTAAGHDVVQIARRMLKDAQDIRDLARGYRLGPNGALRIGVSSLTAAPMVPVLACILQAQFPNVVVSICEGTSASLTSELEDGRLELAIIAMPEAAEHLRCALVVEDHFCLVVRAGEALAQKPQIRLQDLSGVNVVLLGAAHRIHDDLGDKLADVGARVLSPYKGVSVDTLCELVARGTGVTLLPKQILQSRLSADTRLACVPIADPLPGCMFGLMWRTAAQNAPDLAKVRQAIKTAFAKELAMRV